VDAAQREALVDCLACAFGGARDVTPAANQPPHILLPSLDLPTPWQPSTTRALTIWADWPTTRPRFLVDQAVIGDKGEPPRSSNPVYTGGETWHEFSFAFPWSGDDPVLAVQLWMSRFVAEPS
jgi:hypothetical protein